MVLKQAHCRMKQSIMMGASPPYPGKLGDAAATPKITRGLASMLDLLRCYILLILANMLDFPNLAEKVSNFMLE